MNEGPLISKDEHILRRKVLDLEYRWGERCRVTIRPLTWREVQRIASAAERDKLDQTDHAILIVKASLADAPEDLLDQLDGRSAALLQRACLAFSLGEKSVNPQTPPGTRPEAVSGSGNAGTPNVS